MNDQPPNATRPARNETLSKEISGTSGGQNYPELLRDLTIEEIAILQFAHRWAPFGGAKPGDVLVEFGITRSEFYARVDKLLARTDIRTPRAAARDTTDPGNATTTS